MMPNNNYLVKSVSTLTSIPAIVIMAIVASVFATDIYVPSMPDMTKWFGCSQEAMQFSVSIALIGSSIITPIIGPISDAIGRWKILFYGQALYSISCLLAAASPTIELFLSSRFLQGVGSAPAFVLSFAIIADVFKGNKVNIHFAYITTAITTALILAPMIGGFFATHYNWQLSFLFLGALSGFSTLCIYLWLPETLATRSKFSFSKSMKVYRDIMSNSRFIGMAVMPSLMISGIVGFITNASFYFIDELHYSAGAYSLYQASIMAGNTIFSYLASRTIKAFGTAQTINVGMLIFTFGGAGFLLAALIYPTNATIITITVSFFASGIGFVFAAITAEAMSLFPKASGAVSSLITLIRGIVIAVGVAIAGFMYNGTALSIAAFLALILVMCLGIHWSLGYLKITTHRHYHGP